MLCIAPLAPQDDGTDKGGNLTTACACSAAEVFVSLELGHAQQIMQHIELVALGELAQRRHLLGDEGHGFIDPPSPGSSLRKPPARQTRRELVSFLALSPDPTRIHARKNFKLTLIATPRWYFATFSI